MSSAFSSCHLVKTAEYSSLSLISSYFNYTTVIKQDISSGDQSLHSFRWPAALFRNFLKNADVRFPISLKYVCTALPRDKI